MKIRIRVIAFLCTSLAILIMSSTIYFLGSAKISTPNRYPLVQLEEGWTITHASEVIKTDNLSSTSVGVVNNGETITLSTTLPSQGITPAIIEYRSILSTTDVYIDGFKIYSFGYDYLEKGEMLPKKMHFVPLPDDYHGRTLEITMTATEDNAFSGIATIYFGNYNDIAKHLLQKERIALVIGIYLAIFGLILFILSPFLIFSARHDFSITFEGLISVMLGIYILSYHDLLWYVSDRPSFCTFVEYFSLFMIPAAITGFIIAADQIPSKKLGTVLAICNVLFALVTSALHFLNLAHICHFVQGLHLIAMVEGVFVSISLIISFVRSTKTADEFKERNHSTHMLIMGMVIFLSCSIVDIIKFNVMKFGSVGESGASISFLTVGAFIFTICLILSYFFHSIEFIRATSTQQQLEGLAYTDALTGLSNRAKCELSLAGLKDNYTIVSIDLDYLKYTNDNYGHSAGDKLLSGFAKILKDSFTDALTVGRMGGDEFIAILPYIDEERTQRDFDCLKDLMNYRNTVDGPIRYSASYGYAASNDSSLDHNATPQNVYLLADARMYSMKKQHHNESLGRLYDDLLNVTNNKEGGTADV